MATKKTVEIPQSDYASKYGFHDTEEALFRGRPGLSREVTSTSTTSTVSRSSHFAPPLRVRGAMIPTPQVSTTSAFGWRIVRA